MTEDERRDRLRGWFDTVYDSVTEAVINDHIFWEVQDTIRNNPELQNTSSAFYDWMGSTFIDSTALAIRRQLDRDDKSVSLYRFLMELQKYPELISRIYHRTLYVRPEYPEARSEHMANYTYNKFVGVNEEVLDVTTIQQEIDSLKAVSKTVHHYADRVVAHYDTRGLQQDPPKFTDLSESLSVLEKLVLRYLLLLKAVGQRTLLPTFQYDWKRVFRIAWIPPEVR
jgi:hypothetical protein